MIPYARPLGGMLLIVTVIAPFMLQPVCAQEEIADEAPVPAPAPQFDPRVYEQHFDNWVFSNFGGAAAARIKLEGMLTQRVDEIEQSCGLSPGQKRKLQAAGRGEIKRFFDSVEEARRKIRYIPGPWDNVRVQRYWQEAQPLRQ